MIKGNILIIDDDDYILLTLRMFLEQYFQTIVTLNSPSKIQEELTNISYDVIILDMNFQQGETSGKEGLNWLKQIKETAPETNVLLMTAYGEVSLAVEAMKLGAIDFIIKPWQNDKLLATVKMAFKLTSEEKKVLKLKSKEQILSSSADQPFAEMIGKSKPMRSVYQMIKKVAKTEADVLILGENGTGKEVAARAIHRASDRSDQVFISVDLGSITPNLFESELFGHKKGSFTDAKEDRTGRFEAASGGTLFLDEIGNLSSALQTKLLTVLQNRQITKLGTNHPVKTDVRVICATNSNLKEMVQKGTFREDLLYRINTVEIIMPPLQERLDDLPILIDHFLQLYCRKYQKPQLSVPDEVLRKLKKYSWPGNIRELQHALERAVIMSESNPLTYADFSFLTGRVDDLEIFDNYNLENLEAWAINNAIKKYQGNISNAAKELGLSRGAMYRRMEKYNIK